MKRCTKKKDHSENNFVFVRLPAKPVSNACFTRLAIGHRATPLTLQQVKPFMNWECPVPTPPMMLDKAAAQNEMTLAGQALAAHLLSELTFISPLQSSLYCASNIRVGHRLVAGFCNWDASPGLSTQACSVCAEARPTPLWLRIKCYLNYTHSSEGRERHCLVVAIELLPSFDNNHVTVINAKSTVVFRAGLLSYT